MGRIITGCSQMAQPQEGIWLTRTQNRYCLLPLLEVTQPQISPAIDSYPRKTNDSNFVEGHVQGTVDQPQDKGEINNLLAIGVFLKTTIAS